MEGVSVYSLCLSVPSKVRPGVGGHQTDAFSEAHVGIVTVSCLDRTFPAFSGKPWPPAVEHCGDVPEGPGWSAEEAGTFQQRSYRCLEQGSDLDVPGGVGRKLATVSILTRGGTS